MPSCFTDSLFSCSVCNLFLTGVTRFVFLGVKRCRFFCCFSFHCDCVWTCSEPCVLLPREMGFMKENQQKLGSHCRMCSLPIIDCCEVEVCFALCGSVSADSARKTLQYSSLASLFCDKSLRNFLGGNSSSAANFVLSPLNADHRY